MADQTVARFYVSGYEINAYDPDAVVVKMQAVTRGEHNKTWAKYTPSASLTMTIKNEVAAKTFIDRVGREFEVLFTPVEKEDPPC